MNRLLIKNIMEYAKSDRPLQFGNDGPPRIAKYVTFVWYGRELWIIGNNQTDAYYVPKSGIDTPFQVEIHKMYVHDTRYVRNTELKFGFMQILEGHLIPDGTFLDEQYKYYVTDVVGMQEVLTSM